MQGFLPGIVFVLSCIILFLLGYSILLVYNKVFKD